LGKSGITQSNREPKNGKPYYGSRNDRCVSIPEDILQNMNTVDLIQTCLNYPLKGNVYAYANVKDGVEHISLQFNGFKELLLRKDNFKNLK